MIIDAHAHIYPEKIAEKATEAIGNFYSIPMDIKKGTPDFLIENGKKAGITGFLVHSVATKKEQVRHINDFIFSETQKHKEFIAFMTLHEDMTEEEIAEEITLAKERGFKGIKLHPDFQRFYIDGDNAKKIYRVIKEMNLRFPILFHTGDVRYGYSEPERLISVAKEFPSLLFIGAHFGCYSCFEKAELYKDSDNVFFDTSSSLAFISKERAKNIISHNGAERFFFGTDFPMWDACEELKRFDAIDITDREKQMILSENLENFLGLK